MYILKYSNIYDHIMKNYNFLCINYKIMKREIQKSYINFI